MKFLSLWASVAISQAPRKKHSRKNTLYVSFYFPFQSAIPIMLSGPFNSSFLPPHSYIHAGQFESPAQLARYLKHLLKTP